MPKGDRRVEIYCIMDQLRAAPYAGFLQSSLPPSKQSHASKKLKKNDASFMARCLYSSFWAHVSRLPYVHPTAAPPPSTKNQRFFLSQAKLIVQTSSSWLYVSQTGPGRVMKISRSLDRSYREFRLHMQVEAALRSLERRLAQNGFDLDLPYVPECHNFCPDMATLPGSETFSRLDGLPKHGSGYFMECIRPLSHHHAKYLIRRYLTSSAQSRAMSSYSSQPHFLAKVYLGDTKPLSDQWNAELHDRPAYLDHLLLERVEITYLAASMGATLAILHWMCGIDAKGVEFVLGRDNRGHVQFWLIDFSDCQPFKRTPDAVAGQLVDAVVHSEPFWPRWINIYGLRQLWARFRDAYLEVSYLILDEDDGKNNNNSSSSSKTRLLPHLFMSELEKIRGPGVLLA